MYTIYNINRLSCLGSFCCPFKTNPRLPTQLSPILDINLFCKLQVNLNRPCSLWPDDYTCVTKFCDVKECEPVRIFCDLQSFFLHTLMCQDLLMKDHLALGAHAQLGLQ